MHINLLFTYVFSAASNTYGVPVVNLRASLFPRMAMQVMEALTLSITVLDAICWVMGVSFLFGAIGRYIQYRHNPAQSPIGRSFFLGALGIALLLLTTIGQYALPGR
jgi:hypothetical protein